ncbi:hypothetical protein [Streptomyces sp. NPDC057509]|uniref:hypothetical protein n=1 Tax=Streptomyces sp. NPDC057509 TaxID=3346152 RepID=UPI003679F88B
MTTDHPTTAGEYRARAKEQKQREAFREGATRFVSNLALLPLIAFILMLAVGAVHGFAPAVPAIGYGTTILLIVGADALAHVTKKFCK